MASWTDRVPPVFNPYIQEAPIDQMVAVGMQKQQQYDQGLQRIQSEIDRVAGLEIVRPQDREYLQSKLNDLGSKLRTVAAGDFSNFQLVNSVAGMAGKVAKDENVINAVQSTAQRKKLMQRMQTDVEKGNYNPANQLVFNESDTKWFNDPNVGAGYTGRYKTPHDVWAKIKNISDAVGIDEKTAQELFRVDSLGRRQYDKDGNPIWDNIMVEKTLKGKDASKILSAFEAGLDAADYEQLGIEGIYKYRGASPEALKEMVIASTNERVQFNNGKIEMLKLSLSEENNKKQKDVQLIESISKQIEYFQNQNSKFISSRDNALQVADSNPDSLKASMFTNDYLSTMARTLSSQDITTKYSVNPLFTVSMEMSKFNQSVKEWETEQRWKQREDARAQLKLPYEIAKLQREAEGEGGSKKSTGIPQGLEDITSETLVAKAHSQYDEKIVQINDLNYKIALQSLRDANPINPGESNEGYDRRLRVKLEQIAKAVNPNSGSINEGVERIATEKLNQWQNNPESIPATMVSTIGMQSDLMKEVSANKARLESAKRRADITATAMGVDVKAYEKAMERINPMKVTLSGGRELMLSKEDLVDFVNSKAEKYQWLGGLLMSKEEESAKLKANERLTRKFGRDLPEIMSQLYARDPDRPGTTNPLPVLENIASAINNSTSKDYMKIYADEIAKSSILVPDVRFPIYQDKLKDADFRTNINTVLQDYATAFPDQINQAKNAVLSGKFAGSVLVQSGTSNSSNKYFLEIDTEGDEAATPIEITGSQFEAITGENAPTPTVISGIQEKLYADGTTNSGVIGNPATSYYTANAFTNFSSDKYSLRADLEADAQDRNTGFLKLYLIDKNSGKLVDSQWMTSNGKPRPFRVINEDGTPNMELPYLPIGFNKTNIATYFNRPIE
jgi:hypothetical protein